MPVFRLANRNEYQQILFLLFLFYRSAPEGVGKPLNKRIKNPFQHEGVF